MHGLSIYEIKRICHRAYLSARTYVVFLGPVGFLKKANDYFILFSGCMVRTKMVVGSPGMVADTSYDVINMAPVYSLIWGKFIIIVSIRDFFVGSM